MERLSARDESGIDNDADTGATTNFELEAGPG